ncbi:hypothetical protein Mapa_011830 [Marchantia paleacea]|nr:hypothetical protein Mapa_011830 [Marchantia paleacea]
MESPPQSPTPQVTTISMMKWMGQRRSYNTAYAGLQSLRNNIRKENEVAGKIDELRSLQHVDHNTHETDGRSCAEHAKDENSLNSKASCNAMSLRHSLHKRLMQSFKYRR